MEEVIAEGLVSFSKYVSRYVGLHKANKVSKAVDACWRD
jgi:hypothetical protein